jgi:Tfp pilus assembly protein PilX
MAAPDRDDDAGVAMVFVVLCMLISMGLAVGVLGVLTSELRPTEHTRTSQRTIAASQAGLQVAMSAIRQAYSSVTNGTYAGDPSKLPCHPPGAPLTGDAGGLGTSQAPVRYEVTIQYYTISPQGQDATWRTARAVPCTTGTGTSVTPVYALLRARGVSSGGVPAVRSDRTSEVVYRLNSTDEATLGGLIHSDVVGSTTSNWCWQAEVYPPVPGTRVVLAACAPGRPSQTWAYRTDYSIVLARTQTATVPPSGGYCISADANGSSSTSTSASLQPCVQGQWNQLWGYGNAGQFRGVNATKTAMVARCLTTAGTFQTGTRLDILNCSYPRDHWTPDSTVGAGAAGAAKGQLVNYGEYGRCLDVTAFDLATPWLIDYPCKQDPTSDTDWNQRFVHDATGTRQLRTSTPSGPYCLTTPSSVGGYVLTRTCAADRVDQRWRVLGPTGDRSTAYTVVDDFGRCLSLGPHGPTTDWRTAYSSITADACDGTFRQKWNAPPLPSGSTTDGERETTRER